MCSRLGHGVMKSNADGSSERREDMESAERRVSKWVLYGGSLGDAKRTVDSLREDKVPR